MSYDNNDDYIRKHAREELERIEAAKRARLKQSQESFGDWIVDAMEKVGRAVGHVIAIPVRIISSIWDWLFG